MDHERQPSNHVPLHLYNAIHPLCNQVTEDSKGNQPSGNAKEPVQILNILARNYTGNRSAAVVSCTRDEETYQFIPQIPVTTFMGSTIVPRTVSLPRMSDVFSWRSFILMLICAR
jgi:hypothetical protein